MVELFPAVGQVEDEGMLFNETQDKHLLLVGHMFAFEKGGYEVFKGPRWQAGWSWDYF